MDRMIIWKTERKIIYEINIFQKVLDIVVLEFEILLYFRLKLKTLLQYLRML